eukprot:gnl/TRDRNA2_/TRDRNA2_176850_c0_seq1.p1 gnl/TRDRNA2_/TRDRNA2_176850_c0~~gnl/TRDRNA2_/TRDRNA2_176850_c0_seq1.p1  ORF type:complete len:118 (-),score=7.15 gnl/TRDRNA2_/TRDRNA2_176850_c0_seq1:162-515(-)
MPSTRLSSSVCKALNHTPNLECVAVCSGRFIRKNWDRIKTLRAKHFRCIALERKKLSQWIRKEENRADGKSECSLQLESSTKSTCEKPSEIKGCPKDAPVDDGRGRPQMFPTPSPTA